MIDRELLAFLRCPENGQRLTEADPARVADLNREISAGALKNRAGRTVSGPLQGGLVREDGKALYPVRGNLPVLLIDEAIPVG